MKTAAAASQVVTIFALLPLLVNALVGEPLANWRSFEVADGPDGGPEPRGLASVGYDSARSRIFIQGGLNDDAEYIGDTWYFDISEASPSWVLVPPPSDAAMLKRLKRGSTVFASRDSGLVIVSGQSTPSDILFNDALELRFDTLTWQLLHDNTEQFTRRYGSAGGIMPGSGEFVISHGFGQGTTRKSDMFSLNLSSPANEWKELFGGTSSYNPTEPHSRCLVGSAISDSGALHMYGGCLSGGLAGGPCPSNDNWVWTAAAGWNQGSRCITARRFPAIAPVPVGDGQDTVLFGGNDVNKQVFAVSQAYGGYEIAILRGTEQLRARAYPDSKAATQSPAGVAGLPQPRSKHSMVTMKDRSETLMFGGVELDGDGSNVAPGKIWVLRWEPTADVPASLASNFDFLDCERSYGLPLVHGLFMFFGWGLALQAGAFVARYYRHRDPWWFRFHRAVQVGGLLCTLIGLGLALPSAGAPHFRTPHAIIGLLVCLVGFMQPFNAWIRPHKQKGEPPSTKRVVWELLHKNLGRLALLFAVINIGLGLYLYLASMAVRVVYFIYVGILVTAYICAELGKRGMVEAFKLGGGHAGGTRNSAEVGLNEVPSARASGV